jgi:acyl carrier protein
MSVLERDQVETKILETIKEFVEEPDAVTLDAKLVDLDIGSLDFVEIAQVLEDEFDIEILGQESSETDGPPPEMLTVSDAINALIERVEKVGALPSA